MNKANIGFLVVALILIIFAVSVMVAISEINKQQDTHEIFYNKRFIPAMVNVSDLIPQGYSIVVSHPHSYLNYFINHDIVTIPKKITSEKSLLYFMVKRNLKYLLVYDNRHYYPLNPIFSSTELKNLRNDFSHLASYGVDDKTRFQIYQMNRNWKYSQ